MDARESDHDPPPSSVPPGRALLSGLYLATYRLPLPLQRVRPSDLHHEAETFRLMPSEATPKCLAKLHSSRTIGHNLHMTTGLAWCPAFVSEQNSLGIATWRLRPDPLRSGSMCAKLIASAPPRDHRGRDRAPGGGYARRYADEGAFIADLARLLASQGVPTCTANTAGTRRWCRPCSVTPRACGHGGLRPPCSAR